MAFCKCCGKNIRETASACQHCGGLQQITVALPDQTTDRLILVPIEGNLGSTNRSFGFVFTVFFMVIALLPLWNNAPIRLWALIISCLFFATSLVIPGVLAPLNRLWTRLGLLLNHIVSPVALGILFYGVFTPIGLLMRMSGKDPLILKLDRAARTYWIERTPPGPAPESLRNQF